MTDEMNATDNSMLNERNKNNNISGLAPNFEFDKHGINDDDIKEEDEQLISKNNEVGYSSNLKIVLESHDKLKELIATVIKFSNPVLMQGENALIFPHTINVIQGQAGVHKSRLAENMCSALLKMEGKHNELLGFRRFDFKATHTVVYVDTERNLTEQLPYALQSLQLRAGFSKDDQINNFKYISLLQIKRKERFETLTEYLYHLRKSTDNPLFIVLDVSTDCIEDFNKVDHSMGLIDLMNMTVNEYNVIFLCIIHENPRSEKARGHFGTELMNKASTVIQVRFEKDSNQEDTDIIRVKNLKCRSTTKHPPFYIRYCKDEKGLILADTSEISDVINSRKHKASNEDIIDQLEIYLGDGTCIKRIDLLNKLCIDFKASQRTIETRIKEIVSSELEIFNEKGEPCKLLKEAKDKEAYYKLKPYETF